MPIEIAIGALSLGFFSLLSPNPGLTIAGAALLPVFFILLWRTGEPPALLFAVGYQWLQVFTPVMNANLAGLDMSTDVLVKHTDIAAYLGFLALAFLALGMRIGRGNTALDSQGQAYLSPRYFTVKKLIITYIASHLVAYLAMFIASIFYGLYQPMQALAGLRWAIVFIILWAGFTDKRFRQLAIAVLVFEVGLGFMQFFSAFKFVLFITLVVTLAMTTNPRRLFQMRFILIILTTLLFLFFWQAVKGEYRGFLNQGTGSQAILVSPIERIGFLADSIVNINIDNLQSGLESGAERTGYLEYFARSIQTVPKHIPYQEGRLWGEAITFFLMPRLFFPDKGIINDSERVNEFSGIRVAGAEQGTSISLGYVAESYIDFGSIFMSAPIFFLGIFWGWSYRLLATTGAYRLLSFGVATSYILSGAILFESSNMKIVGGALVSLLVGYLVLKYQAKTIWLFMIDKRYRNATSSISARSRIRTKL